MPRYTRPALTRRAFGGAAAATMLTLLAACGSDDPSSTTSGAAGSGAFPASVEHQFGTTEVTAEPQRVVVVGLQEQDALLALGKVPVATTEWFGEHPGAIFPWAQEALGDAEVPEVLTNVDGIEFEKVAALKPDLIVGMYAGLTQQDYDTLSKIAPTVAQPKDQVDYGVSWQEITTAMGTVLGKPDEAAKIISDREGLFAAAAEAHPEFQGKTGLAGTIWEGYYVYGPSDPRSRFMESLGFTLPEGLAEVTGTEFGATLSKERTELLDVDALVLLVTSYPESVTSLAADPLYAALDVSTKGGTVLLEDGETLGSAMSMLTPLSIPTLLEGVVPQLAEAVDGDPATKVTRAAA